MSKLWTYADRGDMCRLYIGWFACICTGFTLPATIIFTGDVFESYDPAANREEGFEVMKFIFILVSCINLFTWMFPPPVYNCRF